MRWQFLFHLGKFFYHLAPKILSRWWTNFKTTSMADDFPLVSIAKKSLASFVQSFSFANAA